MRLFFKELNKSIKVSDANGNIDMSVALRSVKNFLEENWVYTGSNDKEIVLNYSMGIEALATYLHSSSAFIKKRLYHLSKKAYAVLGEDFFSLVETGNIKEIYIRLSSAKMSTKGLLSSVLPKEYLSVVEDSKPTKVPKYSGNIEDYVEELRLLKIYSSLGFNSTLSKVDIGKLSTLIKEIKKDVNKSSLSAEDRVSIYKLLGVVDE